MVRKIKQEEKRKDPENQAALQKGPGWLKAWSVASLLVGDKERWVEATRMKYVR